MSNLVDLYCRLSVDRDNADSVERQERDLRAWAGGAGLTVRKVWIDSGKSGYKRGVERQDFDGAIAALTAGEVGTLAVWKLDRLSRRGAGQIGLVLDDLEAKGGRIYSMKDGLDSSIDGMRTAFILMSEQARGESRSTSIRVAGKNASQRAAGMPPIGKRRFGFLGADKTIGRWVNTVEHPDEGPTVRALFERFAAGEKLFPLAAEVGLDPVTVRTMLRNRAYAGFIAQGVYEVNAKGVRTLMRREYLPAAPEVARLVDPVTFEAVQSLLDDPARKNNPGNQPVHLASGLALCGVCGGKLTAMHENYVCRADRSHPAIRRTAMNARLADEALDHLLSLAPREDSPQITAVAAERAELERKRAVVQDQATWEGADVEKARKEVARLGAEIARLTERLSALQIERVSGNTVARLHAEIERVVSLGLTEGETDERLAKWWLGVWADLPLEDRREVLGRLDIRLYSGRGADRINVEPK